MPRSNETIDVSIVNVDVFVTDRQGNCVRGLTAADFEIREDGRPQPITNFAEYAAEPARRQDSAAANAASEPAGTSRWPWRKKNEASSHQT